jgi:hypothetical protein
MWNAPRKRRVCSDEFAEFWECRPSRSLELSLPLSLYFRPALEQGRAIQQKGADRQTRPSSGESTNSLLLIYPLLNPINLSARSEIRLGLPPARGTNAVKSLANWRSQGKSPHRFEESRELLGNRSYPEECNLYR